MAGTDSFPPFREETSSYFLHTSLKTSYSIAELIQEFTRPCGRFLSPLSLFDKVELVVVAYIARSKILRHLRVVPPYAISPNWQVLLNYLYKYGIIAEPRFVPVLQRNDFPYFNKVNLLSRFDQTRTDAKQDGPPPRGYGISYHVEEAYAKAVGELLERYFLTQYRKKDFVLASYNTLTQRGEKVLDIDDFPKFLPWQKALFPRFVSNKDSMLCWVYAQELTSGIGAYVPAQTLFWRYNFDILVREPILRQSNSNGQAGHFSFVESALSALYECIERDSFLIFWLNTLSPPRIDIHTIQDEEIQRLVKSIERLGIHIYLLDTTTDLEIPSCVSVIVDTRGSEPLIRLGAAAGFNVKKNILSSMLEAVSIGEENADYPQLARDYKPFSDPTIGREERIRMWQGAAMLKKFEFFISGDVVAYTESRFQALALEFATPRNAYEHVLSIFRNKGKGYEVYCHTVQNPVLKKLGYYVTKVVVPKLVNLYLNEHMVTLDSTRLHEVPKKLGYKKTTLNPWPHPFP